MPAPSAIPTSPLPAPAARRRCFTLVEMLVVIALIALLVTLLLVALKAVQSKARATRTLATMEAFANACSAFQQEHGFYPGIVPENVLAQNTWFSPTHNALLHLMGGAVSEQDVGTTAFENTTTYPPPSSAGGLDGWSTVTFGSSSGAFRIKVNPSRLGEGPVIDGRSYKPYFTPSAAELAVVEREAPGGLGGAGGSVPKLPDVIDAWGQPIIYLRRIRESGPLVPANVGGAGQFDPRPIVYYTSATTLGRLGLNQAEPSLGTILPNSLTAQDYRWTNFARIIGHPALTENNNGVYTGQARGAFVLISAGPDGIYFAQTDGAGTPRDPVDNISDGSAWDNDPRIVEEYDDIVVFGG